MGKKKKKKRKKTYYNKKTFKNTVCSNCNLCGDNPNPDFCYTLYKDNPERFLEHSFKRLAVIGQWPQFGQSFIPTGGKLVPFVHDSIFQAEEFLFKSIFCDAEVCDNNVDKEDECPL